MIRGYFYRALMRIAHKYNWHYAPPIFPSGDAQLWCQWCGFRQTYKKQRGLDGIVRYHHSILDALR